LTLSVSSRASAAADQGVTPTPLVIIRPRYEDRAAWEKLARGYHAFYGEEFPAETYDRVWARLHGGRDIYVLGAYDGEQLVGIVHYLFHEHVWQSAVCYLQDLYVDADARRRGVGRALIAAVEREARSVGAFRVYWMTKHDNETARHLYDKVATFSGFIRYEDPV
jgi:GNAT superfamily N-acetyltransferase